MTPCVPVLHSCHCTKYNVSSCCTGTKSVLRATGCASDAVWLALPVQAPNPTAESSDSDFLFKPEPELGATNIVSSLE